MNSSAWFYRVFADRWLWCILLFGLALRLYKIDSPILDGDSFRQGATASIARNYYENGFELLNPRITGWGTIHEAGLWPNEFPLYPFVVACLYVPLGEHVWIGRLLTALFCLVGAAGLYALIKRLEHPLTARFAALWYLIAPQAVYHGRCFHRHPVAIGLMLVALAAFAKWVEEKKPAPWIGMTVCAALALLMMPPLVFYLIPAYVIYRQLADRSWWKNGWIWLAGGLMFLPALLWYSWAYQQYASYSLSSHGREDFRNWTSAHYYLLWWKHDLFYQVWRTFWDYTLGPLGATFAAAGNVAPRGPSV
ncbi:MAG TPA: glycosyltransferase family 39 protein [bacterium]|nr:glycosyltransferase family 39 protein [bacterium]